MQTGIAYGTNSPEQFLICPHIDAPYFDSEEDARKAVLIMWKNFQLMKDMSQTSSELTEIFRQAGLVNLFFFLTGILAYSGPFTKLNRRLHMDMCNFRQSDYCMRSGARAAAFMPRSTFKTTCFTIGASVWEAIRNPNIRIAIVNANKDKAIEFVGSVGESFTTNELFAKIYSETVPTGQTQWNQKGLVLPSRTRHFPDPTFKPLGAAAAAEGGHHDLMVEDDLAGMEDLNSERQANADMEQRKAWVKTNNESLPVDETSRIFYTGTRYAVDDVHSVVMKDAKLFVGFDDHDFKVNPEGEYTVYYRKALEKGEAIFPEVKSKKALERMAKRDYWTYITQYMNDPTKTGMSEFFEYEMGRCLCEYDQKKHGWTICRVGEENYKEVDEWFMLDSCDVVMAIDPAGTDVGISAKTSKTSIVIVALDCAKVYYIIWAAVGYFSTEEMFNKIFEGHRLFPGYIRETVIESNAMQKIIAPVLRPEQERRNLYINPQPVPASGNKVVRIRSGVGLPLSQGRVYSTNAAGIELKEEIEVFPMSKYRMDALDSLEKAIAALSPPATPKQLFEQERRQYIYERETADNIVGY